MRPGTAVQRSGLRQLVRCIAETAIERLGSFLILEIWSSEDRVETDDVTGELRLPRPEFQIRPRRPYRPQGTVATLDFALQEIRVHRRAAEVQINMDADNHPSGMRPLMSEAVEQQIGCHVLGLEVRPIFRNPETGEVYDRVARTFGRQVSHALKKSFFAFALNRTQVRPEHYYSLGTSRLAKQVTDGRPQVGRAESSVSILAAGHADQRGAFVEFVCGKWLSQGAGISIPTARSRPAVAETPVDEHSHRASGQSNVGLCVASDAI